MLLRQIISWARGRRRNDTNNVAVTASTGMAAVNIGGVTLHSWAGIGLGNGDLQRYVDAVKFGPGHWKKVRERWMEVKTLIIDESNVCFHVQTHLLTTWTVSMIDAALFDKLVCTHPFADSPCTLNASNQECIARMVRNNKHPFGGIQVSRLHLRRAERNWLTDLKLVLSGDFFQLPPVELGSKDVGFAFQAQSWNQCISSVTTLTRVFRQKEQCTVYPRGDGRRMLTPHFSIRGAT